MKQDKIVVPRINGLWCWEYDCWPENHPGCSRRNEKDCDGCPKSIKKISFEKIDERDNFSKKPFYCFPSKYIPILQKKIVKIRSPLDENDNYQQSY